jgi:hypothetical protein
MHFEPNIPIIHLRQLPTPSTGAQLLSLPVPSHPISCSSRQLVLAELVTSALFFNLHLTYEELFTLVFFSLLSFPLP